MYQALKALQIGKITIPTPIIQGGMGVRISMAGLVSAVSNAGCLGTLASVGLGRFENLPMGEFVKVNNIALREEIRKTRKLTNNPFAVNIMGALTNFYEFVNLCVEEKVDIIVTGAGLPLDLPQYVPANTTMLVPIVSSSKALYLIIKKWMKKYNRIPDAVIIEGPLAGGHLGYRFEELKDLNSDLLMTILQDVKTLLSDMSISIPIIVGGGIFDGETAARYLRSGADGIQMATRFVCTTECEAHINFKKEYLRANADDIVIINSPVGLPGRVIKNDFVERVLEGKTSIVKCKFKCLRTCDPNKAPYCIAKVLADAADGKLENAFVFAGQNAYRCTAIKSVFEVINEIKTEIEYAWNNGPK